MKEFYQNKGIMHETTCTNNPQQNGVVESKYGLNIARALHFQANLPIHFWSERVLTIKYMIIELLPLSFQEKHLMSCFLDPFLL